jgi:hypothetical protein
MKNLNRTWCLLVMLCTTAPLLAQTKWPREILFPKTGGKVIIYQPQPDALEGNKLTGRVAIAVKEKASDPLVFGALFVESTIMTEKDKHKATLQSVKISNAKITGLTDTAKLAKLIKIIEDEVPKWKHEMSLDDLVATIKKEHPNAEIYNNDPPKIIYRNKPTTLVFIDGEPKIQKDKNLEAERVINTPFLVFKEGELWNMYIGGTWYKSPDILSGWVQMKTMSKKVSSVNDQVKKQEKENNKGKAPTEKPVATDIVVSTVPSELIQTKGEPEWEKIDSTVLKYAANSTNDIILYPDGQIYILVTGRWFKSKSFDGPWVYNEPDKLPADFAKIPEGSEKDNVLVSVSGTPEAEEAIIDAEIPQTAKVDRKTASVKVEYDGEPQLENIEGTSLQRVKNSNLTVLKEETGNYFALDNGIWFVSSSANGPWKLADTRPKDLENIPSKSVAYNSKFVHIYEATSEYVIVGYTGGYLNNFIQGDPVVVFGTGFYYAPWYGAIYYPAPVTYGFGFCYNPYTGWSMGMAISVGFVTFGFGYPYYGYGGGWYGPPMYLPPYRPPYYGGGYYGHHVSHYGNSNIGIDNGHNNIYNRPGGGNNNRPGVSNRPNNNLPGNNYRPGHSGRPGVANSRDVARPGGDTRLPSSNNLPTSRPSAGPRPSTQPNNVFADRNGDVFQRDNKGMMNQRDNRTNSWNRSASAYNNSMQRDVQSRDRSMNRTQNYNRAASSGMYRGGGGMSRGGGGGRRR